MSVKNIGLYMFVGIIYMVIRMTLTDKRKAVFMTDETKLRFDLLKSALLSKTKIRRTWEEYLNVVMDVMENYTNKLAEFKAPDRKPDLVEPDGVIEVPVEEDPNFSD